VDHKHAFHNAYNKNRKFDSEGIPLFKYMNNYWYHPVLIEHYALGAYDLFIDTNEDKYKKIFITQAEWLIKNLVVAPQGAVWYNHHPMNFYGIPIKPPYISGMAQGQGISVLLRAYHLTNDESYLSSAKEAYKPLTVDVKENGAQNKDEQGNTWLEEYPTIPTSHVFNGFIFAIFGIYDLYRVTEDKQVFNLFTTCIKTVETNLDRFDSGFWSFYDLKYKRIVNEAYHALHIKQLKILYKLTGIKKFQITAEKWEKYRIKKRYRIAKTIIRPLKTVIIYLKCFGIIGTVKKMIRREILR